MTNVVEPLRLEDIRRAASVIRGVAVRTPLIGDDRLDSLVGATLLCKVEAAQRTGSFKFRGAFHRLSLIPHADAKGGVVAVSSGNHGAAVACAAEILGLSAIVYVPEDIPDVKRSLIQSFGAEMVTFDRSTPDREAPARAHAVATGATFIHPFEDRDVMLGQGTAALELHEQIEESSSQMVQAMVVPMSGGGLMAGCASAMRQLTPSCEMIGVEPAAADDTARSFRAGYPVQIDQPTTIADGLAVTSPGATTFAINRQLVADIIVVSEGRIVEAMRLIHDFLGLRVEPSGAAALAAILTDPGRFAGRRVGLIFSGGNVDRDHFDQLLELAEVTNDTTVPPDQPD